MNKRNGNIRFYAATHKVVKFLLAMRSFMGIRNVSSVVGQVEVG